MTHATITDLERRLKSVQDRVNTAAASAGRDPGAVTIVAVSKTVDLATMQSAYRLGLRHFGENRVQDARQKLAEPMPADCTIHLIGQLQTNKASLAVDLFQVIESVDRPSLIAELEKQAARRELLLPVLLQVNVAGESQKAGCEVQDAPHLAMSIAASTDLRLDGLMTMAPLVTDPESVRHVFSGLRDLRDQLRQQTGLLLDKLSMGMTNDFEVAVQEGATHVRIGRAIFEG